MNLINSLEKRLLWLFPLFLDLSLCKVSTLIIHFFLVNCHHFLGQGEIPTHICNRRIKHFPLTHQPAFHVFGKLPIPSPKISLSLLEHPTRREDLIDNFDAEIVVDVFYLQMLQKLRDSVLGNQRETQLELMVVSYVKDEILLAFHFRDRPVCSLFHCLHAHHPVLGLKDHQTNLFYL